MRPKIAMWSDYRSPTPTRWKSPYRRNARPSTGPKILLAAVVLVAGVIGVSGIYPHIIDAEWVRNAGPHAKRPAVAEATTRRGSGSITAIPLSPRGAATTGDAAASIPRGPAVLEPPKGPGSFAAVDVSPDATVMAPADLPDAQVVADSPVQPALAAPPAVRPAQRYVARAPVVKKRVVRTEHHRNASSAYAQYGGWGGWSGFGSPYHF